MSALAEMLVLLEARRPNALLLADAVRAATDAGDLNQVCVYRVTKVLGTQILLT